MVAIAVVAPTPIATVRTAAIVNVRFLVRVRIEIRISLIKPMQPPPAGLDTIQPLMTHVQSRAWIPASIRQAVPSQLLRQEYAACRKGRAIRLLEPHAGDAETGNRNGGFAI